MADQSTQKLTRIVLAAAMALSLSSGFVHAGEGGGRERDIVFNPGQANAQSPRRGANRDAPRTGNRQKRHGPKNGS